VLRTLVFQIRHCFKSVLQSIVMLIFTISVESEIITTYKNLKLVFYQLMASKIAGHIWTHVS